MAHMRADICNPDDKVAFDRFRQILKTLGATLDEHGWVPDVDMYKVRVGTDTVTVFVDPWSVDIDGPSDLVNRIIAMMKGA